MGSVTNPKTIALIKTLGRVADPPLRWGLIHGEHEGHGDTHVFFSVSFVPFVENDFHHSRLLFLSHSLLSIACFARTRNSSTAIAPLSSPLRNRTATAPEAASLSPITSM